MTDSRGAKGPQAAFPAAMHAIRGAGKKPPVNLVLVAEGGEEVSSPNFAQVCHDTPHVRAALEKCIGIFMPSHSQEIDGSVVISLGFKGDIECDLVASSEKWGRGATLDQPAWHLVQALNTLVTANGDIEIVKHGGYNYVTSTPANSKLIQFEQRLYERYGIDPMLQPRSCGSWPGISASDTAAARTRRTSSA